MAKKKPTQAKLKKKLDSLFSLYIRHKYADENGIVECYTCGKKLPIKRIHNGHFMSRGYLATRFDERNVRPQCPGCNLFGGGKVAEFGLKLEKESPGIVQELMQEAKKITYNFPYEKQIAHYEKLLKDL